MGVGPVEPVAEVVYGDRVRPYQLVFIGDEPPESGTVHANPGDVRMQTPVGEEDVADARMHAQAPWIGNAPTYQSLPVRAVHFGYVQTLVRPVQPVYFPADEERRGNYRKMPILPAEQITYLPIQSTARPSRPRESCRMMVSELLPLRKLRWIDLEPTSQ